MLRFFFKIIYALDWRPIDIRLHTLDPFENNPATNPHSSLAPTNRFLRKLLRNNLEKCPASSHLLSSTMLCNTLYGNYAYISSVIWGIKNSPGSVRNKNENRKFYVTTAVPEMRVGRRTFCRPVLKKDRRTKLFLSGDEVGGLGIYFERYWRMH